MKNSFLFLAVTMLMAGTTVTSCKSNTDKTDDAVENVNEANSELKDVQNENADDAVKKANDMEWQTYKTEILATISSNEARIAELKTASKKSGATFSANYLKSIDDLEQRNTALKTKITNYENNQTDWESFKREADSDLEGLGKAFKDLTVNNKK
jgi:chromosome segregation ATPase